MDHPILSGEYWGNGTKQDLTLDSAGNSKSSPLPQLLEELKQVVIDVNKEWARKLGIKQAAATTCTKPSGTVSQLVDSASGIHPRHNPYYIRTVRCDKKDPIYHFLKDQGVPCEDALGKEVTTAIFSFPMKAPENSIFREDRTAIEQLELWKIYATYWCEHKPSITVYVKENEWLKVAAWVYENFDLVSGVSFLPYDGGSYKQAPYQDITKEEYEMLLEDFPSKIDWNKLKEYEMEDFTESGQTLACVGGVCEL